MPLLGDLCAVDLVMSVPRDLRTVAVTATEPAARAAFLEAEAVRPRGLNPESGVRRLLAGGRSERLLVDTDRLRR